MRKLIIALLTTFTVITTPLSVLAVGFNACPKMPVAASTANQWVKSITAAGATTTTQPAFSDISGNLAVSQLNSGTSASSSTFWRGDGAWSAVAGTNFATQTANTLFAGPTSGSAATPTFRTMTPADVVDTRNRLYNGAFDLWNWGTTVTVANTVSTYQADRWYVKNSLGTNGVITFAQVTGVTNGSRYGASVKITTAPTAAQVNGTELYQTLPNDDTYALYNQTASFQVLVKALGNVNQVGVQFYYKTTEAKVDTSIGSEQTCTVNSSTFATCSISGQALGTSLTVNGVIGVRIRITTVSSGNTYDLNNGFVAEQAIVNLGSTFAAFQRMAPSLAQELSNCQKFYYQSGNATNIVPSANGTGALVMSHGSYANGGNFYASGVYFPASMRTAPTVTIYDSAASPASGKVTFANQGGTLTSGTTATTTGITQNGFYWNGGAIGSGTAPGLVLFQYIANAEI